MGRPSARRKPRPEREAVWSTHDRQPGQPIPPEEITSAIQQAGSVSGAARLLKVHRNTLLYWMLKHGVTVRRVAVIRGGKSDSD